MGLKITGIGYYLPQTIETAKEVSGKINKSEKWIISRTGVRERRVSSIDVDQMAAIAASEALGSQGPPDLILNASGVGEVCPSCPNEKVDVKLKDCYSFINVRIKKQ